MASKNATVLLVAAAAIGFVFAARRSRAAEVGSDDELIEEIVVTAKRLTRGSFLDDIAAALGAVPLGIRNNNPMNIRETDINWQGELPHDGDGYEDFVDAGAGIRAGAIVLLNYWRIHRLNTVRGIITRWAPPADNNPTVNYITFVSRQLDVDADDPLEMNSRDVIAELAAAIIQFENGQNPYTASFIEQNTARAFA